MDATRTVSMGWHITVQGLIFWMPQSHRSTRKPPECARLHLWKSWVDPAHKWQSILVALREADDETAQLSALHDLCEMLAISTEESLSVFPVDQLIPILVRQPVLGILLSREC